MFGWDEYFVEGSCRGTDSLIWLSTGPSGAGEAPQARDKGSETGGIQSNLDI